MGRRDGRIVLQCAPEVSNTLSGDNGKVVADQIASMIAFTARSIDGNEISSSRVAIVVATDKISIEDSALYTPEMVDVLLEQFFLMIATAAGPAVMMQVMESRQLMAMDSLVNDAMEDIGCGHENLN